MTNLEKELDALRESGVPPSAVESVTIETMNKLAQEIADLRDKEDEASNAKKPITKALEAAENRMAELLLENGMQNYRAPSGLVGLSFRTSVRQPQGEDQVKFYEYLKKEGRFDDMISVNSQKLNSFYKEQFELAKENGADDFSIPGLTEVKINPSLTFKRTK